MTKKFNTLSVLLAGTFLSFPGVAAAEEITVDYLNSLTGPNVTWSGSSGTYSTELDGQTFYYDYVDTGRTVYSERQFNTLSGDVDADFVESSIESTSDSVKGGAIYNSGSISDITGNFIGNHTQSVFSVSGSAIYNSDGGSTINNIINSNFIGNYANAERSSINGGAIYNGSSNSTIGNIINSNFIGNYANAGKLQVYGGVIYNGGIMGDITGDYFIGNYAQGYSVLGGVIYNGGTINNIINSNFIGNYAKGESSYARGGAIFNSSNRSIGNIINSNFIDNYVVGNSSSVGGAIYSGADLNITADNGTSLFSGNTVNGVSNAIYMSGSSSKVPNLNLSAVNDGILTFDDGIKGNYYNLNVSGDGSGEVAFNNSVENVTTLTLNDNAVLRLGTGGSVQTANMTGGGTLKLDVSFANGGISTGVINVSENLSGDYSILANPVNNGSSAYIGASSVFLTAPNDEATFGLARVIGSPYEWDVIKNTTDGGYSWALSLTSYTEEDDNNGGDDGDNSNNNGGNDGDTDSGNTTSPTAPKLLPEVYAGIGLQSAAIEQTRSLTRNIRNQVASHKLYCPGCGVYDYAWNGYNNHNTWINVQGESANIDKPVKIDAKIWGVEAGFDVQNDLNNTLGLFVSYRNGDYDLKTSDIDIDSYLAGLYYRYDRNMNWLFATVYGGAQKAEAQTDDKIAKFDTDGVQFGASVEAGHTFALSNDLTLDPSLGISYTQINFDDAHDNVGKEYSWKDVKHFEAELGAKLEKQIDYAKVYVKPSIIQTWTSGDSVRITGLNKLSTYDDGTLGRIELGGRYGFTDALSAYGWVNYTFGSDYDATALGAGLNYSW